MKKLQKLNLELIKMKNKNMNLLQVNLVILFMDFMLKSIRKIIFIRKMIFMN